MSSNTSWTSGTIRQIRIDLFNASNIVLSLQEIEIIPISRNERYITNRTMGLPADRQWAVDWEINQAYNYGIDFFIHS